MLVVPVKGDKIKTMDDGDERVVSSFSNLKDKPAVYLDPDTSRDRYVYFSDVVEINGVSVEYESDSKVFKALGPLKRQYNLPQERDLVKVKLISTGPAADEVEEIEVTGIRLHSNKYGISRGLLVLGQKSAFSLNELLDVKRSTGSEKFDPARFHRYYRDYLPFNLKSKR